jgi:hypothetical protein
MIPTLQLGQCGRSQLSSDPYWSSVVLLLDMETGTDGSTSFVDRSANPRTLTAIGNAQVDTALAKFGTRSLLCDGAGSPADALDADDTPDVNIGTGDFTVEGWMYTAAVAAAQGLAGLKGVGSGGSGIYIYRVSSAAGTGPSHLALSDNVSTRFYSNSPMANATWQHVAWCRAAGVHYLFLAGDKSGTNWADSTAYDITGMRFGKHPTLDIQPAAASFDEIRVTKGVARYTANFTPPDAPFPQR